MSQVAAGKKHGGMSEVDGVKFDLKKSEIASKEFGVDTTIQIPKSIFLTPHYETANAISHSPLIKLRQAM